MVINYNGLLTFSGSGRIDKSNLFGYKANRKAQPLWSIGMGWNVSSSDFYNLQWLPFLKTRISYGFLGNLDITGATYAGIVTDGPNMYGGISGSITGIATTQLQHEKISMINIGVDFIAARRRVNGSVDYYFRRSKDLISNVPLDPTTGNESFKSNAASMRGRGYEINLNVRCGEGALSWHMHFMLSRTIDKVTSYPELNWQFWFLTEDHYPVVRRGFPLSPTMAFTWAGLDPVTGDPRGMLNGGISKDYALILQSPTSIRYIGSRVPPHLAGWGNKIKWKAIELYALVALKAGHYFRRPSINYSAISTYQTLEHSDYKKRWQKSGDELSTSVPSRPYTFDPYRDLFYTYSEVLIDKGDHLRLQDLRVSYTFDSTVTKNLKIKSAVIYVTAANLGIIWKATKADIDPDYVDVLPRPKSWAIGIRVEF